MRGGGAMRAEAQADRRCGVMRSYMTISQTRGARGVQ
jgi:hypothetical protein